MLPRLRQTAGGKPVALGVDAPIGLPHAYAARHAQGHRDFPAFLASLRHDSDFFRVCAQIGDVGPSRPFYPFSARDGPRRQAHAERLGIDHSDALMRLCDLKTGARPRAASLFWTLGPNQVGKAALSLWRDLLLGARQSADPPALWPFEGGLHDLLRANRLVVAETYPAEALRQLGLALAGSKRRQADRRALAPKLGACMARLGAAPDDRLRAEIETGFGADPAAEDRFDSLLGLLGMLQVIGEPGREAVPDDARIRRWEGWILGQASLPSHAVSVHSVNGDLGAAR